MTEPTPPSRYAIPLAELERGVRVGVDDQVEELPDDTDLHTSQRWDEERRQARLAGGA
jgi:hypothetical protein